MVIDVKITLTLPTISTVKLEELEDVTNSQEQTSNNTSFEIPTQFMYIFKNRLV